jgi:hypothetical protein
MAEPRYIEHLNQKYQKPLAIEAGHVYALQPHKERHEELLKKEFAIADAIGVLLKDHVLRFTKIVLVDETDAVTQQEHSSENGSRHLLFIGREMSRIVAKKPEEYELWRESAFQQEAEKLVQNIKEKVRILKSKHIRLSGTDKSRLKIGSNNAGLNISFFQKVAVHGGAHHVQIPSCSLFDLAVYKRKLQDTSCAITVLPLRFKEQQREVKELFSLLGEEPPVVVVYVDDATAAVVDVESWSAKADSVAGLIKIRFGI